jgi:ABC-type branched-subunit amino acid transport system permease subunit
MKTGLQSNLRVGIVFGIVMIFLTLIGFNLVAANLIGSFFKTGDAAVLNMCLFIGLIGLWLGSSTTKQDHEWLNAAINGAMAGAVCGLIIGGTIFLLGSLFRSGVALSTYLAQLVPSTMHAILLGTAAWQAALVYWVIFALAGALGGILSYLLRLEGWRKRVSSIWVRQRASTSRQPIIQAIRSYPRSRMILYGLGLVVLFILPLGLGQYRNYIIILTGIYVLLGLGLNIVVGLAGLLDLGYVAFFAIGAYTTALLTAPQPHHLQWSFWVVLPIAVVLASLAGVLLGVPVLRMRGDYLAIVTLGFGEIIRILLKSDLLTSFTRGPQGVSAIGGPGFFGLSSHVGFVYLIFLAILLIILVTTRLQNSRIGRAWVAMREDETVARAMGIDIVKHKLLAFAIGAAFAGLGGALFASQNHAIGPEDFALMVSINVVALIIVGGMGSIPGVIAGAFVLKGLPEILRQLQDYRIMTFGALLVVMMVIRPEGLIPSRRRSLEIHGAEPELTEESPAAEGGKA